MAVQWFVGVEMFAAAAVAQHTRNDVCLPGGVVAINRRIQQN
jgi:hypothetical protein